MFNTEKCLKDFDAILAWVPYGDSTNRRYYDLWGSDPRITDMNRARLFLGYDTARQVLENDANLLARCLYHLITETFYGQYKPTDVPISTEILDDLSILPGIEAIATHLSSYGGKPMQEWLDSGAMHTSRSGKIINLKNAWDDAIATGNKDVQVKVLKNYTYFILKKILCDKFLKQFTLMDRQEKVDPKNVNAVKEVVELFSAISSKVDNAWETWLHRDCSRLTRKLKDAQITNFMDDNNIQMIDPLTADPVKSIREIYTEWFKSMGAKFRIVPDNMKMNGSSQLIDKFNYCFAVLLEMYLKKVEAKKPEIAEPITAWLQSHPLGGNIGSTVDYHDLNSYYSASFDDVEYPATKGTQMDFYNQDPKEYSYTVVSYYTPKGETEPRKNVKEKKVTFFALLDSFVKSGDKTFKDIAHSMNSTLNKHNLEDIPDGVKTCVVISCHEYDIVGQSTNRKNWHSCQDIYTGRYKSFVETGLQAGVLIAYYCTQDDNRVHTKGNHWSRTHSYARVTDPNGKPKINISNPLGRILIKPFVKEGEVQNYNDPNWILLASKKYGEFPDDLIDKVQDWLDENWNAKIIDNYGKKNRYNIARGVYRDTPRERTGVTF